jgi:hypothetical protein
MHAIILGAFSGAATVCAVSTNEVPTCFSPAPSDPVRPSGSVRLQHTHFAAARAAERRHCVYDRPESGNNGSLTHETLDSANAVGTIRCPYLWDGSMKVGYLHMKRTSQTNALCEIAGRLPIKHLHMPSADQSYFDRRFKAAFGQTPRNFRLLREEAGGPSSGSAARSFRRADAIKELAIPTASAFASSGSHFAGTRARREGRARSETLISKEAA